MRAAVLLQIIRRRLSYSVRPLRALGEGSHHVSNLLRHSLAFFALSLVLLIDVVVAVAEKGVAEAEHVTLEKKVLLL